MAPEPDPFTFLPHRRLRSGHVMTVFTWGWPRRFPRLPAAVPRLFDVAPHVRVLAHCHWHEAPRHHPTLLLLHGLEGSSQAHYMRGMADKGFRSGLNIVRLNQRNCGGTEHLSDTLYHSGLTADPAAVLRELIETDKLPSIAIAGYSLGGNLALKLAGELGADAPPQLQAVAAVSPTMDLERCVRALERRSNAVYQWNFVRNLKGRMRRKARLFPRRFPLGPLRTIRTVREFDEAYTAPHFGFRDAAEYYHRASALRVVDRIRVPTLILASEDDPFVPVEPFADPLVSGNPAITIRVSRHGGHCAFLGHASDGGDGYWAERVVVRFALAHCAGGGRPPESRAHDQRGR